jgi:hypothetical protein
MASILSDIRRIQAQVNGAENNAESALSTATDAYTVAKTFAFNHENYIKKLHAEGIYVGLPTLYIDGDLTGISKENKVSIEYTYTETTKAKATATGSATLKWQGDSSIKYAKKNFTIAKMSTPIDVGWGSQKKYCLKANFIDPTHARNIISARLWSQIVATHETSPLLVAPNNGAMDGFPIMLVINDEFYGLYTFNIPKDAWAFSMGDSVSEYLVTAESVCEATRFKALCARDDSDFAVEYAPDDVEDSSVFDLLDTLLSAAIAADGSDWQTTLKDIIDLQSVLDYYIFTALIGNDGAGMKNYILATYDATKWYISAYDLDSTFGSYWHGQTYFKASKTTFKSLAGNKLFWLFWKYSKDELKTRYAELRSSILSEDNIQYMFNNFEMYIPAEVLRAEQHKWPTLPATSTTNIAQITNFYRLHTAILDQEIESL